MITLQIYGPQGRMSPSDLTREQIEECRGKVEALTDLLDEAEDMLNVEDMADAEQPTTEGE